MYEQLTDTTAKVTTTRYTFYLDSGEIGLPEHGQLMSDFQDAAKLARFCELLDSNPSTAFTLYFNE